MPLTISILIVGISVGALVIGLFFLFFQKKQRMDCTQLYESFERLSQNVLKGASEQLLQQFSAVAKERLAAEKQEAKQDLESRKNEIAHIVKEIRREMDKVGENLLKSEQDRIRSFSALKEQLETHTKTTKELRGSAEDLKRVLSNNQMRGQFGEQQAEELLKMAGFVKGVDYELNKAQEQNRNRPDMTIYLPDGSKINVDVKFPYKNLINATESENSEEKQKFTKLFNADVREKIKEVSTRNYINPEEKTVDFVLLFIPNEMIFSFIYKQLHETWQEAMQKKVVLCGPFNFISIIRMVRQSYEHFRYQKNIHTVIGYIQKFEEEFGKYNKELDTLGARIESVAKQYSVVATTRTHQLVRQMDKIKIEQIEKKEPENDSVPSLR